MWGAKGPEAFDCSGLVTYSLAQVGITFPDGTANQWPRIVDAGTTVNLDTAIDTYGALLFRMGTNPNHVAISLGDGNTIEARGSSYGVGIFPARQGRSWTGAGTVPELAHALQQLEATR